MTSVMVTEVVEHLSPADEKRIERLLAKARTALVLEHPFIGNVALNLPYIVDYGVKTAATNGKNIRYNPHFIDSLNDEERKFVVAHECLHPMLEHTYRRNGRNHKRWNQAADYVVNKLLSDEKIGKVIQGALLDDNIHKAGGGTTDGIYNMLPDTDEGDRKSTRLNSSHT